MASYVLDTGIIVTAFSAQYSRSDKPSRTFRKVVETFELLSGEHDLIASVVSLAELQVVCFIKGWDKINVDAMNKIFNNDLIVIDILNSDEDLKSAYAEIDTYSTNGKIKHDNKNGSITMGKNDLWIAATAKNLEAELITFDTGFRHLPPDLLTIHIVEQTL